jgi:hypothetical protein
MRHTHKNATILQATKNPHDFSACDKVPSHPAFTHFIYSLNYKWDLKDGELDYSRLERLARDKQSSLLSSFVSCEENEVL